MKGLVCKYCGGNHFNKTKEGYECIYCHTIYEVDDDNEEIKIPQKKKGLILFTVSVAVVSALILVSSLALLHTNEAAPQKFNPVINIPKPTASTKESYSVSQLNNPERNVRMAELSLNQENIELAKASIKEYGGNNTAEFEKRLTNAQKEHDRMKKERPRKAPKADMIVENPDSEFAVTTYYRENGFFAAYGPDFDQYSSTDILRMWGQPDEIITDPKKIKQNLAITSDEEDQPDSYELKVLRENWQQGKMTWREVRALLIITQDKTYANYSKAFIYEKQGKPNVYFENERVGHVTPVLTYVSFSRLPEKYPKAGLGKYPDDFPENYGSDGLYHEK